MASQKVKTEYVMKTRLANYNASLRLEGYAPSSARIMTVTELEQTKATLIAKYTHKSK
ncbi:YhfG family protein [Silvimonas iriomotensis]|uniref:DUF2559 domain-containing protein n=1 Tax=Silvimonas iriomotensis TaxID=449662 RepID=A0ABQ2PEH2_9NEIS|nr:YhfG family protein [Silvimonas iriomotensis]GGP23900.1 hypothetical protein GCM10010970_39000 [Silvimonas iriomotensis]